MAAETWPKGTVARYLTVGGATVDVLDATYRDRSTTLHAAYATCTGHGCGASHTTMSNQQFTNHPDVKESDPRLIEQAKEWAQAHAETCRALPKQGDPAPKVPVCGSVRSDMPNVTCELPAGHDWRCRGNGWGWDATEGGAQ